MLQESTNKTLILSQFAQLLAIDWIMETRTALWELENGNYDNDFYNFVPVESSVLTKFQNDLNLLRCLTINMPVSSYLISISDLKVA